MRNKYSAIEISIANNEKIKSLMEKADVAIDEACENGKFEASVTIPHNGKHQFNQDKVSYAVMRFLLKDKGYKIDESYEDVDKNVKICFSWRG